METPESIGNPENASVRSDTSSLTVACKKPGEQGNYFVRHWQGELPLSISYWVNGVILNVAMITIVIAVINSLNLNDEFYPGVALLLVGGTWIACLVLFGWQSVGIWRSARNYKNTKPVWGTVAQCSVIIWIFQAMIDFGTQRAPLINELMTIFLGDGRLGKYAFRMQPGGQVLEFSGGITFGAAKEFRRLIDAMSSLKVVVLDSNGGRISEARRIGTLIKSRGLDTYVPDHCLSACTIIFLSGRDRVVGPGGKLGFHQPDFPGLSDEHRRLAAVEERRRLQELGVSEAFARKALSTPPTDLWIPTFDELISARVATRIANLADVSAVVAEKPIHGMGGR